MPSITEVKYPTPQYPRQVRLDSVTACNGQCLCCHRHLSNRKGEMPMGLIVQILKDISKWEKPLEEIVPVNYGEFFLRKDWFQILTTIAQSLPYTEITLATNGFLVTQDVVVKLCKIPTFRVINFSINAFYDETYEMFMGLPANTIPQMRKAVAMFRLLRPDIRLKVSMIFDPEYQTDLERDYFINYWIGWAEPWIIPPASAGRPEKKPYRPVKIPCRSIFSDFVVGYDGKLSSCCFDAGFNAYELGYYSGNILKDWHNPQMTEFRNLHNQGRRTEIDLCKQCTFS